ncbi:NAD(P)H-hydrate dehydratase [Peteryoungia desertarenae]|uniref:Bifunctional NAD(P)H-hydrate repair enzyme n=1 Tax=Peteryoungia desertarenae TaxID=1813451 RepID=A0ABX6QQG7_9HYPH|nr:NAD(P)H-hydrate dehydratase [Peteryoungia desertarenae]QLF70455.1 NAD(P)H-hydrate dehydratase [Peteryoungia desertarenae]
MPKTQEFVVQTAGEIWTTDVVLAPKAMAEVDAAAIASGIPGYDLMERAGQAVAATALRSFPEANRYIVLCGPGNNGGDGYVAARELAACGASAELYHVEELDRLSGDARTAFERCHLPANPLPTYQMQPGDVIIDAIFGAGLSRDLPPELAERINAITAAGLPVLAVDLPSGIDGATGEMRGAAFTASKTVTFMAQKPGHLLLPGRDHCGSVEIVDIGIPRRMVEAARGALKRNHPGLWQADLPRANLADHKYRRGHVSVFSGPFNGTGACRLSAAAAARSGAGIVAVAARRSAVAALVPHLTSIMLHSVDNELDLAHYLDDPRHQTFVLGPGFGDFAQARSFALAIGHAQRTLVLDADGITAFKGKVDELRDAFADVTPRLVLTPHEGEFHRLFPEIAAENAKGKVEKTRDAAGLLGAIVVYKGADTVIAAPDGSAAINDNAPPWLATAGSGDVLAGMIAGLIAQRVPPFAASCAAVYLHGEAAKLAGSPMTAEDLLEAITAAMASITQD